LIGPRAVDVEQIPKLGEFYVHSRMRSGSTNMTGLNKVGVIRFSGFDTQ
jgi:hypothetical protein